MKKSKTIFLTFIALLACIPAFAQENGSGLMDSLGNMEGSQLTLLIVLGVVLGLVILLFFLLIYLMSFLSVILSKKSGVELGTLHWWSRFKKKTDVVEEGEVTGNVLEGHSYDGITELDNFMPPWLQYVFVLCIGFGIIYFINYSVLGWGKTQLEEYQDELFIAEAQAEERKETAVVTIDESNVEYDRTREALDAGKTVYDTNCVACHATDGGGGVGPNLADEYWIHGGSISDVFKVVKYGVVEKGMIPWQDQLSPEQMQFVSSYVLTLNGTTPLNPKEPQGEKYEPAIEQPMDVLTGDELELEEVEEQ